MSKCKDMIIGIDQYAKLTNENAEMYAVLKVCKGFFEEIGQHEDSVTYKMICAALEAAKEGKK